VALEASSPGVVAQLAGEGLGVAIVPESGAAPMGLHPLPTEPPMRGQLALVWRESGPSSPAARALVTRARSTFA
jgi:DNA-binding transcriptional LysR family regulator